MPKTELSRLRDKHGKLWREWYELGLKIRDLEATEPKPSDRVEKESRENWDLTLGIMKKAGFIGADARWEDLTYEQKAPVWAFHKVRREAREAIAKALKVRYAPRGW